MNESASQARDVTAYRAYVIGSDGRIETSTYIEAAADDEAIEQARRLVDGQTIELWDRGRRIISFSPRIS